MGKAVKTNNNIYVFDDSSVCYYSSKLSEAQLWHKTLGHMNFDSIIRVNQLGAVIAFPRLSKPNNSICKSCQFGKQTRTHFKTKEFSSSRPLELIHTDINDPNRAKILRGERYFMLLIDDFTRATLIMLLKKKSAPILVSLSLHLRFHPRTAVRFAASIT